MQNSYLQNKIVLKCCPEYYRIINEDFDELDYVTDKVIEVYQTYIFSLDPTNKEDLKKITELNKIIVRYFDDRIFKKDVTNMLSTLKVPRGTEDIVGEIVKAIKNTYDKYMEGFTRNLYIPKWV